MLAGHMRSSSLRDSLDTPTILLPLRRSATVFESWLEILNQAFVDEVRVAINLDKDTHAINAAIDAMTRKRDFQAVTRTFLEPAAWRGPGGVVRDITLDLDADTIVVIVEGNSAPVSSVKDVISTVQGGADGAVGVCGSNSPAGVSAFRRSSIDLIPKIGYFDLKEQFLPALHEAHFRVRPVSVLKGSSRIHDRLSYLEAVRKELAVENQVVTYSKDQDQTIISKNAVVDGRCLIESGVTIDDGVLVHDSVILNGASIGYGAVVARSVVGAGAKVRPGESVVDTILGGHTLLPRVQRTNRRQLKTGSHAVSKSPNPGASRS